MVREIIVRKVSKSGIGGKISEVRWICDSLGLINGRDLDDTSFKIMNELIKNFRRKEIVSSEEISKSLGLERPSVNHHLRNFIDLGLLEREKRKVVLRGGSLSAAIEEMRCEMDDMFNKILKVSRELE